MINLFSWNEQSLDIDIKDGKIYLCAKIKDEVYSAEINARQAVELKRDWISYGTTKLLSIPERRLL
jgi:hypothetical protein